MRKLAKELKKLANELNMFFIAEDLEQMSEELKEAVSDKTQDNFIKNMKNMMKKNKFNVTQGK